MARLEQLVDVFCALLLPGDGRAGQLAYQVPDPDLEIVVDHLWDEVVLGERLHLFLARGDHA